jgi:hypothetical protein
MGTDYTNYIPYLRVLYYLEASYTGVQISAIGRSGVETLRHIFRKFSQLLKHDARIEPQNRSSQSQASRP